ncbi:MAG: abortive infection family protein [Acidobacteriota bacterium]|nr:abortive infection family protein [Acidobacteriota bacterium]
MRSDGQIDERPDVGSREIEAIRQAIVRLRQFRFCGPGDDPDEQLAVTMGYRHLLIQLKRLATPLLPVDAATRLNALDVEIDNIYTVYEAAPEVDALIPVIEKTVDPIETHRLLPELPATERLREVLERRGLSSVREELDRVVLNVAGDPPTSITAASSMLESLFKCFLEDGGHAQPTKKTAKPLWNRASKHLSLDPASKEDDDIRRILSGLSSIVDGIAALRTHTGSAHGRGKRSYRLLARHAQLSAHAAQTLAWFVIETWEERDTERSG